MIDQRTLILADRAGLDLGKGWLRPKDRRVVLWDAHAFPGSHAASKQACALRSRVVWWLHTGEIITGMRANIHHKNNDRSDDRFANLQKLGHLEHAVHHNPQRPRLCVCIHCGSSFGLRKRGEDQSRGKFCSQDCYHKHPRTSEHKNNISLGNKKRWRDR